MLSIITPQVVFYLFFSFTLAIIICKVCSSTMCVSTCQVEFVFQRTVSIYSTTTEQIYRIVRKTSQFRKEPTCFDERYRTLAGTTTLAYRIVYNCTTTESVLELVLKDDDQRKLVETLRPRNLRKSNLIIVLAKNPMERRQ